MRAASAILPAIAVAFLVILPSSVQIKRFQSFAGPYWVTVERFYRCQEKEIPELWINASGRPLNFPRIPDDLQRFEMHVHFLRNLTNAISVKVNIAEWKNNEWKANAIQQMKFPNACSSWANLLPQLFKAVVGFLPTKGPCVVPEGDYSRNNIALEWQVTPMPQFVYGKYRTSLKFDNSGTPVWCLTLEYRVNPLGV